MDKKTKLQNKVKQLDELVKYFEQEQDFDLEEGLKKYEQALSLVKEVKEDMSKFELKIKEVEEKYGID